MLLRDLLREAGFAAAEVENIEISGITADTRRAEAGNLFVALRGLAVDGSAYVSEAAEKGCCFVVSERPCRELPCLVVENAREALARLFDAWYGHPARQMSLIGVTGTNGKTSVSSLLFAILRHAGHSCGLIGTVGCRCDDEQLDCGAGQGLANMTTPDPDVLYRLLAEMRARGAEYVIAEVTSHALAFGKVAPLFWKRAVFTNLTPDHLDLHGDMESYFLEKKKLFERTECAVVSCRGFYGNRLAQALDIPAYCISPETLSEVTLHGSDGVSFRLSLPMLDECQLYLPIAGEFSVENGALAAATALSLGISSKVVQDAFLRFTGVRGRLERVAPNPFGVEVFLDYAHTPDALEKLLLTARGFRREGQRILLLFGCGGDRDRGKRAAMGRIASRLADFVIVTSDNSRSEDPKRILQDILKGIDKEKPFIVIPDRRAAIAWAVKHAAPHDILLLAGKGHEEYEIRAGERHPFSERAILVECFRERAEGVEL